MAFTDEAAIQLTTELQIAARDRYSVYPDELTEARIVGYVLQGEKSVIEHLQYRYDTGFDRQEFMNPCLWSLLETLLNWRRHADIGNLKSHIPRPAPLGTPESLTNLYDFLDLMGMYGEDIDYDYVSQFESIEGEMTTIPGWTARRLAELFAITEGVPITTVLERIK